MTSPRELILRCPDLEGTLDSLAGLFTTTRGELAGALPVAAAAVAADPQAELDRAIVPALTAALERTPAVPARIHFFHGTRAVDPGTFTRDGLLPLSAALGEIWTQLAALAPEIPPERFAALRAGLEAGRVEALTYKDRVDRGDDGPNGVLVREVLVHPAAYSSSEFARIPEIVEDICLAAQAELGVDLEARFERAAVPCIVEFAASPHQPGKALTAACWYAEAMLRGQRNSSHDVFWNFDGQGAAVAPRDIVAVDVLF